MTLFSSHRRHRSGHNKSQNHPETCQQSTTRPKLFVLARQGNEDEKYRWALEIEDLASSSEHSADDVTLCDDATSRDDSMGGFESEVDTRRNHSVGGQSTGSKVEVGGRNEIQSTIFDLDDISGPHGQPSSPLTVEGQLKLTLKIAMPLREEYSLSTLSNTSFAATVEQTLRNSTAASSDLVDALSPSKYRRDSLLESDARLETALRALQARGILPSAPSSASSSSELGKTFTVEKFLYFARANLDHYGCTRVCCASEKRNVEDVLEVDYEQVLEENVALRRQMEEGVKGIGAQCGGANNEPESTGTVTKKKKKKLFGGFWVSYGPASGVEDDDERREGVYGGLM